MKFSGLSTSTLAKSNWLTALLFAALSHFTYVALSAVLIFAGLGLPIPEDIPLVLSGYMCHRQYSPIRDLTIEIDTDGDGIKDTFVPRHIPKIHWMILAGLCGVLVGDSIVFTFGRHGIEGRGFVAKHLRKVMHTRRREKVERHFAKHGNWTVFVGRFMPGCRSIVFAFAGLSRMSYARFLLIDGMAACISVPVFIFLGWRFAEHISTLLAWIDRIKHILLPILLAAAVIIVLLYWRRRSRERRALVVAANAAPVYCAPGMGGGEHHAKLKPEHASVSRLASSTRLADGNSPRA